MADIVDQNWYSNDASTFGDRLVAARTARNLTVKALARQLGVSSKSIDKWENDISEPRANKLQMLSGVLNVSIPWLLTGEGSEFESIAEEVTEVDSLMTELRALRAEMLAAAERMGVLEKKLKRAMRE